MELTVPAKRSRISDAAGLSPSSLRRLQRSAWSGADVGSTGVERIIYEQALKINDLEKDLDEVEEKSKRNEWASRELGRIMESNAKWKEHCDNLQIQLRSEAKTRLKREHELQLKIAESEQQVTALLNAQSDQQMELTAAKSELAKCQARLHGATLHQGNLDRMQDVHPVEPSQELLSTRTCLQTLQNELETARARMARIETDLLEANKNASKQEVEMNDRQRNQELLESKIRALECDAVEAATIKAELREARQQVQDMCDRVSQADEREQLKEQLRITQATSQAQQVKLEAMAEEQYRGINWDAERDELQAEISTLHHALNDLQSVTGEKDVRNILRAYQTREVQSEQKVQQLQTELQHLQQELESMRTEVARVQAEKIELARTAEAATCQVETLKAGNALQQAEIDFLNERFELHMAAAASLSKQGGPGVSNPERFGELHSALKEAKTTQDKLIQTNQKMNEDLQAAHHSKAEVQQELRATRKTLQDMQAQAKHQSDSRDNFVTEQYRSATTSSGQDPQSENPFSAVQRDYLEHQLDVLLTENEQLRKETRQLRTRMCNLSPKADTSNKPDSLQQAELIVAKQTVEDYRTRMDKLGQFFVQNSEQFRTAVRDILGWNVVIKKQAGQSCSCMVHLCLSKGEDTTHDIHVSMKAGDNHSVTEVPAWVQQIDARDDVVEEYNRHGQLPRLLAGVLLGDAKMQSTAD